MRECEVIGLRQYTLRANRRDELIAIFEEQLLEAQHVLGAPVIGTFHDLDDADRFVWIRGFRDMPSRKDALRRPSVASASRRRSCNDAGFRQCTALAAGRAAARIAGGDDSRRGREPDNQRRDSLSR